MIEFFRAGPGSLLAFLRTLDETHADEWLSTGGIYVDGRRVRRDVALSAGQILRVHRERKRYSVPRPLLDHLHAETEELLVLDKPAGLPTHATLDNFTENAKFVLEEELGGPVFTTHRLDVPTQGLLILAKTASAQSLMNKLFARGEVTKIYHARTRRALPEGPHQHWIDPGTRVPRTVSAAARANWWACRLEIEHAAKLPDGDVLHRVRLLTGKTHQIRAQFAAMGAPLVGDAVYGSLCRRPALGLACHQMSFIWRGQRVTFTRSTGDAGLEAVAEGQPG